MSRSPVFRVLVATGLTVSAFVALVFLFVPVLLVPVGPAGRLVLLYALPELGFAAIGLLFLVAIGEDRWFLDYDRPSPSDGRFIATATVCLVGFNLLVHWTFAATGVQTTSQFEGPGGIDPVLLVAGLSVIFVLIVGPSEELFFRGVVQRYLSDALTTRGTYTWTSALFAVFHLPGVTGAGGGLAQYVMVGGILFVVSLGLCWLYDRTRTLLVPALVHGLYNVLVFTSLVFDVMP